jgi:hypothetical protein
MVARICTEIGEPSRVDECITSPLPFRAPASRRNDAVQLDAEKAAIAQFPTLSLPRQSLCP